MSKKKDEVIVIDCLMYTLIVGTMRTGVIIGKDTKMEEISARTRVGNGTAAPPTSGAIACPNTPRELPIRLNPWLSSRLLLLFVLPQRRCCDHPSTLELCHFDALQCLSLRVGVERQHLHQFH